LLLFLCRNVLFAMNRTHYYITLLNLTMVLLVLAVWTACGSVRASIVLPPDFLGSDKIEIESQESSAEQDSSTRRTRCSSATSQHRSITIKSHEQLIQQLKVRRSALQQYAPGSNSSTSASPSSGGSVGTYAFASFANASTLLDLHVTGWLRGEWLLALPVPPYSELFHPPRS